jgi:hypothetical protein
MPKLVPSVSAQTETFTPRELPLFKEERPRAVALSRNDVLPSPIPAGVRIREALRRWLEEEL